MSGTRMRVIAKVRKGNGMSRSCLPKKKNSCVMLGWIASRINHGDLPLGRWFHGAKVHSGTLRVLEHPSLPKNEAEQHW